MSRNATPSPQFTPFQVHAISSTQKTKSQDLPTSSILKTPTAIFVNSRSSSSRTRKLKFANGPVDLETLRLRREGSQDSASSASSSVGGDVKQSNGQIDCDGNLVEVAISPNKKMKVSPESWTAFCAYRKYNDYSNETEKTDYTYSRLSKYRHKEIIPGFPIMPNLSRSPLTRSTNASKPYNFSYAADSYMRSLIYDKAGLRHRARQLNLDSEDETDIISTTSYEERIHVRIFRTISRSLVAIYTSILYYIALSTSTIKDTFSRYFLRRTSYSSKVSSNDRAFWIPWSPDKKYTSAAYFSDSSSSYFSWFRSALYRFYERISTVIYVSSHSSIEYVKVKYSETSGRKKILWFLIPLLLLAGLWLLTAEEDKWRSLDYWGVVDNSTKCMASAASSVFEKSSQLLDGIFPGVEYALEIASSAFSSGFEYLKYFIFNSFDFVLSNILYAFEMISQLWIVIQDFLISFFNVFSDGVKSAIIYIYEFSICGFLVLRDWTESFGSWVWGLLTVSSEFLKASILYVFTALPRREESTKRSGSLAEIPQQELFEQHKAITKLSEELKDFKVLSGDLEALKKRIDDLEAEFRKEKEERMAGDESYVKQLEENHKTLQKFQVKVNHALRRCCSHHSSSLAIRSFLNSQSEQLKLWITENFLQKTDKDVLIDESKIAALISQHTNRSGEDLKALQDEFKRFIEENKKDLESLRLQADWKFSDSGNVSVSFIRKLISDAIKVYDADKTGKVDFALESGGGQVQSIRCTETYIASTKSYILLGWTVYTSSSSPRDAINPGMAPGQCWAFVGSQGYLVLQLSHTIIVNGFTMEHISKSLAPTGHIESAPKNFSMWGLKDETDLDPYLFGEYTYLDNDETLQYFPVAHPTDKPYKFVELKIMSNYGNPNYTCLYRIRVHGKVYHI